MTRFAAAAVVAALACSACGAGTVGQPVAQAPDTAAPSLAVAAPEPKIVAAVFRPVDTSPSDTALTVAWETGKCQFFHSIAVDETAERVVVTVLERLKPDSLCPDAGMQATRTVRLRSALGVRPVYNGGVTPPFLVS